MSKIILDFGSGNTCRNQFIIIKKMIEELAEVDTHKHEVIIKWQLFQSAGENIPLNSTCFRFAYDYAKHIGYQTTASVFDIESLELLLDHDIPFVKIANNRKLDWLIGEVPRKVPVYVSASGTQTIRDKSEWFGLSVYNGHIMKCISKYPADIREYEIKYDKWLSVNGPISDHTIGLELFKKYEPDIWEKHYKLPDSTGLDAGTFAITPEELREIL